MIGESAVNTTCKALVLGMMLTTPLGVGSTLAEAQSAPAATSSTAASNPAPTRESPLLEGKLDGLTTADGKGVDSVMYIANFPPGSWSARHAHPGWEYNYILKGTLTFEVVGKAPFTLKAGEGMYNPRGNTHTVRNASQTEPAQLVSILVKEEGAPVAVNVP